MLSNILIEIISFPTQTHPIIRYGSLGLAVITARCGGLKGDKIRVGGAL
jgi:hypothetical protein